jgi:hypothetical protein
MPPEDPVGLTTTTGGGSVPVPDPTKLTTDAVTAAAAQWRRDLESVQLLIETRLDAMDKAVGLGEGRVEEIRTRLREETREAVSTLRQLIEARLGAMDKANELLATNVDRFPSELDKVSKSIREILGGEISLVEAVSQEKFQAIEGTFASNALALTAALAAQKEAAAEQNKSNTLAITKSEQATKETIAANAAQTANSLGSLVDTIADLKDRLVRLEAGGLAATAGRIETRADAVYGQTEHYGSAAVTRTTIQAAIAGLAVLISLAALVFVAVKG